MNREMRRASKKIGKQMMSLPPNEFEEISYSEIQKTTVGIKPDQAWRNNHYTVQLYRQERLIMGVMMDKWMIRRNDAEPIKNWRDLQNVKNEVIGERIEAYQVFPKRSELVDVANMYWLFTEANLYE